MKCKSECPKGIGECCYLCYAQDVCRHSCFVPLIEHHKRYSQLQTKLEKGEDFKLKDYEKLRKISCENDINNTDTEYDYKYFDWGSIDQHNIDKMVELDYKTRDELWNKTRKKKKK